MIKPCVFEANFAVSKFFKGFSSCIVKNYSVFYCLPFGLPRLPLINLFEGLC